MPLLRRLYAFWRNLSHKARVERKLDEEVRAFVEMLTEEKIRRGIDAVEARRAALIEAGGIEPVKAHVRDVRVGVASATWYKKRYRIQAASGLVSGRKIRWFGGGYVIATYGFLKVARAEEGGAIQDLFLKLFEVQVNHRGDVKRDELRNNQAANND